MSFPLAPAQRQENPRAASSSCVCGSLSPAPSSGVVALPKLQGQKWKLRCWSPDPSVSLCVPNSHRENGTACFLLKAPGSALGTRVLHPETWPPLGKGLLRVWPLVSGCPRSPGWDRALGGRGGHSAKLLLIIVVWGGKLFLDLLYGWWGLPGWRRHGKQEGPLSRVFLKALPYF